MAAGLERMDRARVRARHAAASPAIWIVFPARIESLAEIFRCGSEFGLLGICYSNVRPNSSDAALVARFLDQLHLLWLRGCDPYAFHSAVGGIDHFESQAFVFNYFALLGDAAG